MRANFCSVYCVQFWILLRMRVHVVMSGLFNLAGKALAWVSTSLESSQKACSISAEKIPIIYLARTHNLGVCTLSHTLSDRIHTHNTQHTNTQCQMNQIARGHEFVTRTCTANCMQHKYSLQTQNARSMPPSCRPSPTTLSIR